MGGSDRFTLNLKRETVSLEQHSSTQDRFSYFLVTDCALGLEAVVYGRPRICNAIIAHLQDKKGTAPRYQQWEQRSGTDV